MYSQFESLDFEVNELEVEVQHKQTNNYPKTWKDENAEKFIKICLHFTYPAKISLQFDEFFWPKNSKIRRLEIFTITFDYF